MNSSQHALFAEHQIAETGSLEIISQFARETGRLVMRRRSKNSEYGYWTALPAAIALVAYAAFSCGPLPMKEIQRLPSPDGLVDAVLVMRPTAVVAPDVYELYIVPHKGRPRKREMVLRGDKFLDARLAWERPRLLDVYYSQAHIGFFLNAWQSFDVDNLKYVVEIRLVPPAGKFAIPDLAP
jgi:hypothetical protein